MASTLEHPPRRRDLVDPDYNMRREWELRAQFSCENTRSRRFSGSYIRSFREDNDKSFRSHITVSSTASSPGYNAIKDEINPSTYSFTTALKALQTKAGYINSWECASPEGLVLNSKWNEAEKYICNPLSGEVPMECLSAKTLSGRLFQSAAANKRITMSAPLPLVNFSSTSRPLFLTNTAPDSNMPRFPYIQERKVEVNSRDVGTQSTPKVISSNGSPSPASTPSITERVSLNRICQGVEDNGDSPQYSADKVIQVEEESTKKYVGQKLESHRAKEEKEGSSDNDKIWRCNRSRQVGCLSWMKKRQREKHKSRIMNILFFKLDGCYERKSGGP